ncbi:MAG: hypothetical protein E2O84_01990 [Bacteroidetes bacterium]|nr:MAG: hypothetical protein E2O84_01990 [Bacteroidota bacterium]
MNILVWPTTFGADLWSFTRYLSRQQNTTVKVVLENPHYFERQGVAKLFPIDAEIIRRRFHHHGLGLHDFDADVTIMDNRAPWSATAPKGFMLWHGFGWKGPNDEQEMRWLHRSLRRHWGDVNEPGNRFRWQCFGPWDFKHRSEISGVHADNCRILGAASHDDLRQPIDKELAQPYYPFDIVNRKTILLAPTWHYGEIFSHWGRDADLLERLVARIDNLGANVIIRLHDSFRFEKTYLKSLEHIAASHSNVLLKFKDKSPDNFLDMQVTDALISNFSSIANLFYATGRPSIHIYPVRDADEAFLWRQLSVTGIKTKEIESARFIWKLSPDENGGLLAHGFDELLEQVDRVLAEPDCCQEQSRAFLDTYMLGADGHSCERIFESVKALAESRMEQPVFSPDVTSERVAGG